MFCVLCLILLPMCKKVCGAPSENVGVVQKWLYHFLGDESEVNEVVHRMKRSYFRCTDHFTNNT